MKPKINLGQVLKRVTAAAVVICLIMPALTQPANAQTKKIHLKKSSVTVQVQETYQAKLLTAKNKVIKASAITWSTSNKKVATVTKKGLVKGKAAGNAKITAKYKGKKYILKVAVKAVSWDDPETVALSTALTTATDYHRILQTGGEGFGDFNKYVVNDPNTKNILTQSEIDALRNAANPGKNKLPYKEAVSDVDLYFRALKYGYGAYYYFGGDAAFDAARKKVMNALAGKDTITREQLIAVLQEAMQFCRDGHFSVEGMSPVDSDHVRYEYYYCYDQVFSKDEKGYYKKKNGTKWYFDSFVKNPEARIEHTLLPTGEMVYSPVLFCPKSEVVKSETTMLKSGSRTMKESFSWTLSKAYADRPFHNDTWYNFAQQEGVTYISVRSFDKDSCKDDLNSHFVPEAAKAKGAKAIIFDIRCNGGGSDDFCRRWVKNFCGTEPETRQAFADRRNALNPYGDVPLGQEKFESDIVEGNFISNNIPMIVLVDDYCGSSGESMLNYLKSLGNAIVVGSNSAGAQIGGNVYTYHLPNSGIACSFGMGLSLYFNTQAVDGKGYEPDIWCNPKDAYGAVLKLLEREGYLTESAGKELQRADEINDLTLIWMRDTICPDNGFGRIKDEELDVKCNGKVITDYEVQSNSKELLAERLPDGKLHLKATARIPDLYFTITYKGKDYRFCCAAA